MYDDIYVAPSVFLLPVGVKLVQFLCAPWRRMGKWRYSSTRF